MFQKGFNHQVRRFNLKKLYLLVSLAYMLISTGCIAVVVGAGAGAGTFAYVDGQLSRTYQASYEKTFAVVQGILRDLEQPILEETTDGTQTTLRSERSDGTPITIRVRIIDPEWTEVSVRTGHIGVWKRQISEQFHEFIAERIK
ncbi:MAG: DUF3568 family protein [Desulfobacterales bacterium]|jgi:hypothetical protein|nr:DUF3568 family protein [Deltaproteobacteria bacterium]